MSWLPAIGDGLELRAGEPFCAYLAAPGFEKELAAELGEVHGVLGRLVLAPGPPRQAAWCHNTWLDPRVLEVRSIGDAVRQLRALQRNWALHSVAAHRRARLIQQQLPPIRFRPLRFGSPPPAAPLGSWALLDPGRLLAAPRCSSPFPHGEVCFEEDRQGPPGRAYLKLWEAFTLLGQRPSPGQLCLDLGASPGSWTWALLRTGARVLAVDRALLDPRVSRLPGLRVLRQSAFALKPEELGPVDWLLCDVACYPGRLLGLVQRWLDSGLCSRFVCTLKFQGATDLETAARFAAIPGSRLLHLSYNKHELTWTLLPGHQDGAGAATEASP